jgi:hypothetical protein
MKRSHRFVVVRRPIAQDPEDAVQLTPFKDRKYAYHVLVTNLTLSPWRVYRFYSVRATIEKNIREFVYDYPLETFERLERTKNSQNSGVIRTLANCYDGLTPLSWMRPTHWASSEC